MKDLPDRIRAFVALRLNMEVERAIVELVGPMRAVDSGIRWVGQRNLHLTLRFLGNTVERNLLVALNAALIKVAAQISAFSVDARGTGAFPNLERPRVVWVGLVSESLVRLAHQVEDAAAEVGFEREKRVYSPHLTIGRVRDLRGWRQIRELLDHSSTKDFGATLISEMILYRSILGGEASQYVELSRYRLTGAPI